MLKLKYSTIPTQVASKNGTPVAEAPKGYLEHRLNPKLFGDATFDSISIKRAYISLKLFTSYA